jgi:hypothetical protein
MRVPCPDAKLFSTDARMGVLGMGGIILNLRTQVKDGRHGALVARGLKLSGGG